MSIFFERNRWQIYAFTLGFSAIIFQTILFRNIFAHLGFSEISYIITLFLWLCWGAIGSFLRVRIDPRWSLLFFGAGGISIPIVVRVMTIAVHPFFGITPQWWEIIVISAISSLPALFGGLTFGALTKRENTALLYAFEGFGAFFAGITTMLATGFVPLEWIAIAVSAIVAADFTGVFKRIYRGIIVILFAVALLVAYPFLGKYIWSGFQVEEFESFYGRIVVISQRGESFIYRSGRQVAMASDTLSAEMLVHPVMWAHKKPRTVLLLGGEYKGALKDVLKHNPESVVVPIEDEQFLKMSVELIPSLRTSLSNKSINVEFRNVRKIISNLGDEEFDVILLMPGFPESSADNRFWTIEFLRTIWDALADSGISAITMPVGANLLSPQQVELASSIDTTIKLAWQNAQVWFLDNTLVWIAQKGNPSFDLAKVILLSKNREIETITFNQAYLPILLQAERSITIERQLSNAKTRIPNTDLKPYVYLWGIIQSAYFSGIILESLHNVLYLISILLFIIVVLVILMSILKKNFPVGGIFCSGIWGILSQSELVLALQSWHGNLYWLVGIASGTFLVGSASGSFYSAKYKHKWRNCLLALICLLILLLWLLVIPTKSIPVLFLIIFLSGSIGGVTFGAGASIAKSGAKLYSADLAGSAVGTILTILMLSAASMPIVISVSAIVMLVIQFFAIRIVRVP